MPATPGQVWSEAEGGGPPSRSDADQPDPSDSALVMQARGGEGAAFESLVRRYQALVCLVAFRQLGNQEGVEDVAQESFVKAFIHLGELDQPSHFRAWLLRIAANVSLDHLRRRKHRGLSLDETATFRAVESAAADADPNNLRSAAQGPAQAQAGELRGAIVEAIYALPEEYQVAVAMRYLEQAPYREIAGRLGLREEAVRKRIHRANQMLRRKLRRLWPEGDTF
jgi:RNA polymerase sigma-70 factor (ECF subfamily)